MTTTGATPRPQAARASAPTGRPARRGRRDHDVLRPGSARRVLLALLLLVGPAWWLGRPDQPGTAPPTGSPATSTQPPSARPRSGHPAGVPAGAQRAVVERHVDGDTLWVRADEPGRLPGRASSPVRLLEIDTPETNHPMQPVGCFGAEASGFAERMLPLGSTVYLVADRSDTDRYGRFLRYVWTEDGAFYNLEAVRRGYARAVLYEPDDAYIERLRRAERHARARGRGLWSACPDAAAQPAAPPAGGAARRPRPRPGGAADGPGSAGCDRNYSGCVPAYPPDVDCAAVGGPVTVTGADVHGLDSDGDGAGCDG